MKLASLVIALLLTRACPTIADSLVGDWCNKAGAHLRIDGPRIETAPGIVVTGKYARHQFS